MINVALFSAMRFLVILLGFQVTMNSCENHIYSMFRYKLGFLCPSIELSSSLENYSVG